MQQSLEGRWPINVKEVKTGKNNMIFFNPRSATHNHRLPLSILQIAASVMNDHEPVIIDGNFEKDPWQKIDHYLQTGDFRFFACSVMPGPQLKQAVSISKSIRQNFPGIIIIWGGYFPSNYPGICMESGIIDFVIRGPGDHAFPTLIKSLIDDRTDQLAAIGNLVYKLPGGKVCMNPMDPVPDQDSLPDLPLDYLGRFYPLERYIVRTFLGNRTLSYHSSIGCPHNCGFCGVAAVYHSSWKGKSARKIVDDLLRYKARYGIDAIEFHDSNFFCSHARTIEFCTLMKGQGIKWWAEGRIDTMNHYSDEELRLMSDSGCRLVFMGAETENENQVALINKGPAFRVSDTVDVVNRFKVFGIIPQLSFILGIPGPSPKIMMRQIHNEIRFIRSLKAKNTATELILYLFSPVPFESSGILKASQDFGFHFPDTLEEWMTEEWEDFELRRGRGLPWLRPSMVRYIRNFEVVLAAAYPGISNFHIGKSGRLILRIPGMIRYKLRWYRFPFEIKALLRIFSYQRPEKEGFYSK